MNGPGLRRFVFFGLPKEEFKDHPNALNAHQHVAENAKQSSGDASQGIVMRRGYVRHHSTKEFVEYQAKSKVGGHNSNSRVYYERILGEGGVSLYSAIAVNFRAHQR
jgi:hypothetical protein